MNIFRTKEFEIKSNKLAGDVVIIELSGKLDAANSNLIHKELRNQIDFGFTKIVLDMQHVITMGSSGLTILIGALSLMKSNEGNLKLAHLNGQAIKLLKITNLLKVFESYDSIEEALQSFSETR